MTPRFHRAAPVALSGLQPGVAIRPGRDRPVRQESLRAHNLTLTFRQIVAARGTPISRIELASATGLTRPTISRIVEDLLGSGLITEVGPAHSGGAGRPRVGLALSRRGPAGLGLDIRTDTLAACVVDLTGAVRHLSFTPRTSPAGSARDTVAELARMARAAMAAAEAEGLAAVGATLAVPGPVQGHRLVRFAPALGWRDIDASGLLRDAIGRTDLPVTVDNGANLAALGELYAGDEQLRNFVCVSGELDVGAGVVLDGRLLRGARGWSGELGHVTVEPDGAPCHCGSRGCLESYAGVAAILAGTAGPAGPAGAIGTVGTAGPVGTPGPAGAIGTAGTLDLPGPAGAIGTAGTLDLPDAVGTPGPAGAAGSPAAVTGTRPDALTRLVTWADAGSPEVIAGLERAGRALGIALSNLVNILDIDTVLLGGGYSLLASWLSGSVEAQLRQRVLTARWAPLDVRPAMLGPDAAVIGAALTVVDEVRANPVSWLARAAS